MAAKRRRDSNVYHYPMNMQATCVLYTSNLELKEVRGVDMDKELSLCLSASSMKFLHEQRNRLTAAMLDSPFCFIENPPGGTVDGYCLSYEEQLDQSEAKVHARSFPQSVAAVEEMVLSASSTIAAASSSSASSLSCTKKKRPGIQDLKVHGRVVKMEEDISDAFARFKASPLLRIVREDEDYSDGGPVDERTR